MKTFPYSKQIEHRKVSNCHEGKECLYGRVIGALMWSWPGEARQMHSNKPKSASFMTTEFMHELDFGEFRRLSGN